MTVPYTKQLQASALVSAQHNKVTVPVPPRGVLTRLIVKQTSGALAGFTVDVYDRGDAITGETAQTAKMYQTGADGYPLLAEGVAVTVDDGTSLLDGDIHKLCAQQVVAASGPTMALLGAWIPYVNQDERDNANIPTGAIYLDIVPVGSLAKNFVVAVTAAGDIS